MLSERPLSLELYPPSKSTETGTSTADTTRLTISCTSETGMLSPSVCPVRRGHGPAARGDRARACPYDRFGAAGVPRVVEQYRLALDVQASESFCFLDLAHGEATLMARLSSRPIRPYE